MLPSGSMKPANSLDEVRRLASDENKCLIFGVVLDSLHEQGMDSDDLRDVILMELGEAHCFKSKATEKHYPSTVSDYYSIWIDDCGAKMFVKLLVANPGTESALLVISSFKKDDRYDNV